MTRKASGWTPERRARQVEMIRNWRPFEAIIAAVKQARTIDHVAVATILAALVRVIPLPLASADIRGRLAR